MPTVLDAGVFIHGYGRDLEFDGPITTPAVIDELDSGQAQTVRDLIDPELRMPGEEARTAVEATASEHNVDVSGTDIGLVALAEELDVELVTDDYSLQNLAALRGVECRGFGEDGIEDERSWERYCPACDETTDEDRCPRCGTATATRQRSSSR